LQIVLVALYANFVINTWFILFCCVDLVLGDIAFILSICFVSIVCL